MKKYCKYLYAIPMIAAALMAHSSCQSNNQIMVNTSTVFVCHFISTIYVLNGRKVMTWTL